MKLAPEIIRPELSGPSALLATSTPSTPKLFSEKVDFRLPPPPELIVTFGRDPVTVKSVSVRPPTAAVTPDCFETAVTSAELRTPYAPTKRSLTLIFSPGTSTPPCSRFTCCTIPNPTEGLEFDFGAWVTVTSVPTP